MQEPRDEVRETTLPAGQPAGCGKVEAFEEVYLRYAPRLRKIATGRFGIEWTEADALVHDVFATYLMQAGAVRNVEPYLIGAICNAARNHLRKSGAAEALFCGEHPCAATPKDALASEIERKLLVSRMLGCVGPRCRDLLHRYYVVGDTTATIACGMGTTPGTILVFLHRCRRRALEAYHAMTGRH